MNGDLHLPSIAADSQVYIVARLHGGQPARAIAREDRDSVDVRYVVSACERSPRWSASHDAEHHRLGPKNKSARSVAAATAESTVAPEVLDAEVVGARGPGGRGTARACDLGADISTRHERAKHGGRIRD
jgi:hypothetical protein